LALDRWPVGRSWPLPGSSFVVVYLRAVPNKNFAERLIRTWANDRRRTANDAL
jgi:hypothetical protein